MACKWDGEPKRSSHLAGANRTAIPAELHFQTSKKIAQLTKVIYTLNVRLDEQECAIEAQREGHEERFQQLLADTRAKISHYKAKAVSACEAQQRLSTVELELKEEKRLRCSAELEAKRLRLSSCDSEDAQCLQRLLTKLRSSGGGEPLNADLDAIWTLLRGGKGTKGKVVADIPEKDCETSSLPGGASDSSPNAPGDQDASNQWRCPSCGGGPAGPGAKHDTAEQEEELLERLAENERMTERLQQEIGNLEKSLASKDQEVFKLQKKVCSQKTTSGTQTDVTPLQQPEADKGAGNTSEKSPEDSTNSFRDELRVTLAGFRTVAQDLRETKDDLGRHQRELRDLIDLDDLKQHLQEKNKTETIVQGSEQVSSDSTDSGISSAEGEETGVPPTARETKEAQTEFKAKVAQLLQQVTLLMTAPELSSCNMSDAEKECAELRKRLREAHEQHKAASAQKEANLEARLQAALAEKDAHMQRQEQQQHSEFENTLKHLEEKWQQENSTGEQNHALIAKLECELSECKRLLKSQTEMQTTEMARMGRDLEAAQKALSLKEAELSARECSLMKDLEEERSRGKALLHQSQQHQRQAEAFSRQLDLKRDELIQLRKEAMQQIRNLENYWLEKVNKELEKVKKNFSEEKKSMLENFCKAQRLLKDKILVLQAKNTPVLPPPTQSTLDRSESAPHLPKPRRGSVMSQIEYCIHEEDGDEADDAQERICSSQPNVAKLSEPSLSLKKERFMHNQRFIKRAESVLLPKLQFLSFWKSASNIDKDSSNHAKYQQQHSLPSRPRCNSSGVPLFSPPPATTTRGSSTNVRKRPKAPSVGLHATDNQKCPLLFQEYRSSSCCNLASCQQSGLNIREVSPRRSVPKTRDYYNKRHSVGAKFWIGPLPEAGADCEDTDSESTDSERGNQKTRKEPLLESEL